SGQSGPCGEPSARVRPEGEAMRPPRKNRAKLHEGVEPDKKGLSPEVWDRIEKFGKLLVSSLEPISKLIDAITGHH
ncbi:MAG: hypothetical protein ACRDYC_03425, partial [Acidimicrobiales bacterium]